jgi:hypothetical protein
MAKPLRCARKQPAAPEDSSIKVIAAEKPSYASAHFAREEPEGVVKADEELTTWAEYATQLHKTTEGIRGMVEYARAIDKVKTGIGEASLQDRTLLETEVMQSNCSCVLSRLLQRTV